MWERLRLALAVVLLCIGVGLMAESVLAQDAEQPGAAQAPLPPERATPRATGNTFVTAVKDVEEQRVADLDEARGRAVRCLDPETVAPLSAAAAYALARDLKRVLDYDGKIDWNDWADGVQVGAARFWTKSTAEGPLTLRRGTDGWVFGAETLARVPDMLAAYEAAGTQAYSGESMRDRVRRRFPSLAQRALFLEHWQWLGLVLLGCLAWIVHKIVAFAVANVIGGVLARRGWLAKAADAARNAARPVGFFAVAALVALVGPVLELPIQPVDLNKWVVNVGAKLFASFGAVLVLYRIADVIAARMAEAAAATETRLDDQLVPIVRKSLKILVTVGGALFILDNLEADIWSLLAGAGVAGLAVAFAAQDTIKNLFGSITVFLDRPFQVGDWVIVGGVEGTVEEVGFRSTRVRTFYNSLVSVPNSKLVDGVVDNMGMRRYRRFKTTVGVRYDTPAERIEAFCHGMRAIVLANPHMRHDYFEIYLNDWGASSLDILVYVFFDVPDWDAELRARQNFMLEVIRLARELGVGFAFPTRTLEIEATPERPAQPQRARPVDELVRLAERFGKGGDLSRPEGTAALGAQERGPGAEEARGAS